MKNFRKILLGILVISLVSNLFGCGNTASQTPQTTNLPTSTPVKEEKTVTLTVSAAASLKDAMEEIKQLYSKESPNVTLTYNFGASGALQQQIEQGAPADIFISAGKKQMEALKTKGLIIDETNRNLLENKVVLIAPKNSELKTDFQGLSDVKIKKIAAGEPKSVPAGQYAEEILNKLNIMDKVKPKEVFSRDVREVLTWVETGNVDVGIVYETDAKVSDKVKILAYAPEKSHSPVIYLEAVVKSSKNVDAAKAFLSFISGDKGKAVFEKYGFHMAAK